MNYRDMKSAFTEAEQTMRNADSMANDFAKILIGRLRKVNSFTLEKLKKELTEFNAKTHNWKS